MYGVFLALLTTNIIDKKARRALITSIGIFVAYNLMNGMKAGIDNAAHLGGLVTGLIIGYAYYPSLKNQAALKLQYVTVSLLFIAVLTTSFVMYNNIPNDILKYDAKMKDFARHEAIALEVFNMKQASDSEILSALKDKGLPSWNADLQILDEASKRDIPLDLVYRDALMRDYCKMRIKSYGIIYKAVQEKTDKYKSSIDSCNTQIKAILDSLKK
jgi:rhomboid protease GluP